MEIFNTMSEIITWVKALFSKSPQDREDLSSMLEQATKDELLEQNTANMIEGVLEVQETRVNDVMVPRLQMVCIAHDDQLSDIVEIVAKSGHSRFPVTGENKDEITGIILAKDLLNYAFASADTTFNLQEIMRPAVFIPESKRLNVLLQDFRIKRNHMAIVVDEYGRITGLITIEDVIEQIVGDIEDEHDIDSSPSIKEMNDGSFTVKALTTIEEFNEYFDCEIEEQTSETIGGVITKALGHVPQRGENVKIDIFHFNILRSDNRRVYLLSVTRELDQERLN